MSFFQEITKVPLAVSIKSFTLATVFGIMSLIGYDQEQMENESPIKKIRVEKDQLKLNALEGRWYFNTALFNGYAITKFKNGQLKEKIGFSNGKKEGIALKWNIDGVLTGEKFYSENRLEGTAKTWWANGNLSSESNYSNRVRHGTQKKWYPNGQLAQLRNFNLGKEEGMQKAWLETGKLYTNYEAKNGRFFGLKRSNLCYQLKDEKVQR